MTKLILILVAALGLTLALSPVAEAAAAPVIDHARGKITSIQPDKQTFVVTAPNGKKTKVKVTDDTKIAVDGQVATFDDLAVGQKARVGGKLGGPQGNLLIAKHVRAKS